MYDSGVHHRGPIGRRPSAAVQHVLSFCHNACFDLLCRGGFAARCFSAPGATHLSGSLSGWRKHSDFANHHHGRVASTRKSIYTAEEWHHASGNFEALIDSLCSGEFAKARKPVPGGKEGFLLIVDKPISEETLHRAVSAHGAAVNTGDNVQITGLEFRDKTIVVDLNGGGRPKKHWRDRIQIGMGPGNPVPQSTTQTGPQQENGPPGLSARNGWHAVR